MNLATRRPPLPKDAVLFVEIPPQTRQGRCRSCNAPVYWVRSHQGHHLPVLVSGVPGALAPTSTDPGRGQAHFGCRAPKRP